MIRKMALGALGALALAGCVAVPAGGPRQNWGNDRRYEERREDQRERREDQRERQEDRRDNRRDDRRD